MSDAWLVILGAVLAVFGGGANDEFSAWRERRRERNAIKVSLSDELTEIVTILNKIKNVWEANHTLVPSYIIKDLTSCTSTYDSLRQRLFLIRDINTRKDITTFYRDLKSAVNSNARRAGSLSKNADIQKEQEEIAKKFIDFIDKAEKIQERLK